MGKVNKLRDIWDNIPHAVTEQIDLSQKELINRYMDVFHFGDYFYVIFNTKIALMEYIVPNIVKVLGYGVDAFCFFKERKKIHNIFFNYFNQLLVFFKLW